MSEIQFSINRTCMPQANLMEFLNLATAAGVSAVEIRNDIEGQEFANGMPARELKARLDDVGLKIASINALQRFNDWSYDREIEARRLIEYSAALEAPGVVLCPSHDPRDAWDETTTESNLREGLRQLKPMFSDAGLKGYVEPLGMFPSTMKKQSQAVSAIHDIDGWDDFALCYDTFQYFRCNDDKLFLKRVALIHVSGIERVDLQPEELTEPDRGLIFANDRVGNIAQLRSAIAVGYNGYVSIEPFSPETQRDPDLLVNLIKSIEFIRANV